MNRHLLLFLSFFLFQCSNKENKQYVNNEFVFEYKIDTLQIKNGDDSPVSYLSHLMFDSKDIFLGINAFEHPNKIFLFDLAEKRPLNSIIVDSNLTNTNVNIIGGLSTDSIFFASYQSRFIYLINKDGDVLKYWDIDKSEVRDYQSNNPFFISFSPDSRIIVDKNMKYIFLPIVDDGFHESAGSKNIFHVLRINIQTDEMKVMAFPVGKGKSRGDLFFPDDLSYPQIESYKNKLLLSYPYDENLHVFTEGGDFLNSVNLSFGENEIKMASPITLEEKKNREKARELRIKMPFFESLKYHDEVKLFSRIFHQPSNPDVQQKGRSTVYFWDENFNFKGNVNFGYNQIMAFRSIKTSKGYIFSTEVDNEDYLAHRIKFEVK